MDILASAAEDDPQNNDVVVGVLQNSPSIEEWKHVSLRIKSEKI